MENKAAQDAILQWVKCNCILICDGDCQFSAFAFKLTEFCWRKGNCNDSTEVDKNEFSETEINNDYHNSQEDLSECENEQDNGN